MAVYLDSSALVKLVVEEPESKSLRRFLRRRRVRVSSALARVEVLRAVRTRGRDAWKRARRVLAAIRLLRLDDEVLDAAARLDPASLRSLDAIHLASALTLDDVLESVVTYDARMRQAGERLGLAIESPPAPR